MKYKTLSAIGLFVLIFSFAQAQNTNKDYITLSFGGTATGFTNAPLRSNESTFTSGYKITDNFYTALSVQYINSYFYDKNHVIDDKFGICCGLEVGYDFAHFSKHNSALGAMIASGKNLNKTDWNYMYYDFGVRWKFNIGLCRAFAGVGARYYKSFKSTYENHLGFNTTLGFIIH